MDATFVRRVLFVAGVVMAASALWAFLYLAPEVFLLALAGIIFGVFLRGLGLAIARRTPLPYGVALTIVIFLLLGLFVLFGWYFVTYGGEKLRQVDTQFGDATESLKSQLKQMGLSERLVDQIPRASAIFGGGGQELPGDWNLLTIAQRAITTTFGFVVNVVIIFFVGLYLAVKPDWYRRGLVNIFPVERREYVREVVHELGLTLWWWTMGRLLSMTIIGVTTAIGLALMGVPLPVAMGVLAGLLTFIPNIGPVISVVPPALLALQQSPAMALYVLLFYAALQFVESYFITPLVQQREVELPPVVTIVVQVLLGFVLGVLGIIMAAPLAAAVLYLARRVYIEDTLEAGAAQRSDAS